MEHLVLTKDGLKKLEEELAYLKVTQRPAIAEKIKEAREFGDLSENCEYEAALNAQAIMEARIAYIEEQLKIAVVQDAVSYTHLHRKSVVLHGGRKHLGRARSIIILQNTLYTSTSDEYTEMDIVILQNYYTSGASEVFSAAMQDNGLAVVIGETSAGAGLAQREIPLSNNTAIVLSVYEYIRPSGESFNGCLLYTSRCV